MRHHKAMAGYDCLKFINEAVFSVLVIALSVLLAAQQVISVGTILTAYLCFTQLTGPLRELHRILDEASECVVLAEDYFRMMEIPVDFSYEIPDDLPAPALSGNGVTLSGVSFAYPEKQDRDILRDVALDYPAATSWASPAPAAAGSPRSSRYSISWRRPRGRLTWAARPSGTSPWRRSPRWWRWCRRRPS